MAEWIRMPFGLVSGVSRGMGVLDRGGDHRGEWAVLGGEFWASQCNQWGTLLHSCVEVHEPIKLLFGMVSVVGPGIGVLDGVDMLQGERGVLVFSGSFRPIVQQKCIRLVCEKLTIFHTDSISLETYFHCLSDDIVQFEIELGVYEKFTKM